jgi:single-strand DNA-binding protein
MANYCKVFLMGNIGSEIKTGATNSGLEMASFSLAVNKKTKGENKTTWWKIQCFGNTAKTASSYLGKGLPCFVEGEVQLNQWTGKDGKEHHQLCCLANQITFVGAKSPSQSIEGGEPVSADLPKFNPASGPISDLDAITDLPF